MSLLDPSVNASIIHFTFGTIPEAITPSLINKLALFLEIDEIKLLFLSFIPSTSVSIISFSAFNDEAILKLHNHH